MKSLSDDVLAGLTEEPAFNSIVQLIGFYRAAKMCNDFGGKRIYISKNSTEKSVLSKMIGIEAAQKISSVYDGFMWDIPTSPGRVFIMLCVAEGKINSVEASHELRCSRQTVYRNVNNIRKHKGVSIGGFFYPIEEIRQNFSNELEDQSHSAPVVSKKKENSLLMDGQHSKGVIKDSSCLRQAVLSKTIQPKISSSVQETLSSASKTIREAV
jgi:hypothetical protein